MKALCAASLCSALLVPAFAQAAPLTVVNVGAPAINCIFNPTCTVTVTDSIGTFTLPQDVGDGRLQSRTFDSATGAPGYPLKGYDYRVDMTAMKAVNAKNCVMAMRIDFGPVATLNYKPGQPSQLYVVTSGGLGSVGVSSADLTGNTLTVRFGDGVCPGQTSYFFGLAAKGAPMNTKAILTPSIAGPAVTTAARAPTH